MPSTVETPVRAWAHCVNPRCPGNNQQEVAAIAVETAYSYAETGGDTMFGHPERTTQHLRFAEPDESRCDLCGSNRDLSANRRLQLDDSGYDPGALLDIAPEARAPESYKEGGAPGGHTVVDDSRTTALEAENRELRESIAELRGIMLGKQAQPSDEAEAES